MVKNLNQEKIVEEKSFFNVIVHSFFVIPFLIAVFCLLLFVAINLLTQEKRTAYGYLEDVTSGGSTKRWQGAFELSKILANPRLIPHESRFTDELIKAFKNSKNDDNRVRQYLALAMGRTGRSEFAPILSDGLKEEKEANIPALIYALGMIKDKNLSSSLFPYMNHPNAMIRSVTTAALGNIGSQEAKPLFKKALHDPEPNVQWGAAVSLAQMGDPSGNGILLKLLNRKYFSQFPEVDPQEQDNLMLTVIDVSRNINDVDLLARIKELSQTDQNMNVRAAAYNRLKRIN